MYLLPFPTCVNIALGCAYSTIRSDGEEYGGFEKARRDGKSLYFGRILGGWGQIDEARPSKKKWRGVLCENGKDMEVLP